MDFIPSELIRKKRFGQTHSRPEIRFLVQEFSANRIPDYQMAAWLMAVCFQGMTDEETCWLTEEMRDSGVVLNLSGVQMSIDKHSTGGLGDKTSLILAPLVAAAGVPVPMMAGRGLGHTGGTLDKLESISGFDTRLAFDKFSRQVSEVGAAIIGQTEEICPADRKLYALRDVTGTIDSLPLICGSILSKKLAEGCSGLVLDVKYGSGAFMKTLGEAEALAGALIKTGKHFDKKMTALLTRMDEPLGRFIGNALEVRECLDILDNKIFDYEGKYPTDTVELTLELAGHMIALGGKATSPEDGRRLATQLLRDGSAKKKFQELCAWQGGDLRVPLPATDNTRTVVAAEAGYLQYTNLEMLGLAGILLGAGRRFQTDALDYASGIEVFRCQGEPVKKGDILFRLYAATGARFSDALPCVENSFTVSARPIPQSPLVAKVLT